MSAPAFITREERADTARLWLIRGRIDHAGSEEFQAEANALLETLPASGGFLVIDLGGLDFITSAGLRVLMKTRNAVQARGGRIILTGLKGIVREIFEIAKFTKLFEIEEGPEAALERHSPAAVAAWRAKG